MAVTNNAVVGVALNYLQVNPDETDDVRPLVVLALHGPPVVMPTTMPAHVTCGVVAVTADWKLLELHPSATRRLRLPTGLVEPTDRSLLGASLRLLTEQAGVPSEAVTPHAVVPLDVAAVPVSATREQPEHVHFDVRFLLQVPRDQVMVPPPAAGRRGGGDGGRGGNGNRSAGHRWVPVAEVPGRLGDKLRQAAGVRASL